MAANSQWQHMVKNGASGLKTHGGYPSAFPVVISFFQASGPFSHVLGYLPTCTGFCFRCQGCWLSRLWLQRGLTSRVESMLGPW